MALGIEDDAPPLNPDRLAGGTQASATPRTKGASPRENTENIIS